MQTRNNLKILVLVKVFAVLCDPWRAGFPLLLRLSVLDLLLHSHVLVDLGEVVGGETQKTQHGTVGDRIEHYVIVWSMFCEMSGRVVVGCRRGGDLPCKVQDSESIDGVREECVHGGHST